MDHQQLIVFYDSTYPLNNQYQNNFISTQIFHYLLLRIRHNAPFDKRIPTM